MPRSMRLIFWIYYCILIGYHTLAVPLEYDGLESDRELSYDFDTEQSQARYDPRILSEELKDGHVSSQERAAACYTTNMKYEHGQKVKRSDPCEVCLCVDGEIFCWWKKCDHETTKRKKDFRKDKQKFIHYNRKQLMKKNQQKYKMMKFIPKKILNFPQHLPAILHFDFDKNETKSILHPVQTFRETPLLSQSMAGKKMAHRMRGKSFETQSQSLKNVYGDGDDVSNNTPNFQLLNEQHSMEMNKEEHPFNKDRRNNQQVNVYEKAIINEIEESDDDISENGVFMKKLSNKIDDDELKRSEKPEQAFRSASPSSLPILNGNDDEIRHDKNSKSIIITGSKINNKWNLSSSGGDIQNADNTKTDNVQHNDNTMTTKSKLLEFGETEKIQFVDVPLAKHYIITSSGSVENADILASENVLSQFRNRYSVVVESTTSNIDRGNISNILENDNSNKNNNNNLVESTNLDATVGDKFVSESGFLRSTDSVPNSTEDSLQSQRSQSPISRIETTSERPQLACVVMGNSYKIGTILPQDTGNCLQCICIEGANQGDSPRVTCSPHNCPPLVLPDLFDTTGY